MKSKTLIKILLIVLSTVVFIRPSDSYIISMLKSFVFHFMIGYMIIAIIWILKRRWILAASAISAFLILFAYLYPYKDTNTMKDNYQKVRIAHFNVLKYNHNHKKIIDCAVSSNADFISFQEVDSSWEDDINKALNAKYPYSEVVTDDVKTRGIAVYSKYPLKDTEVIYFGKVANIKGKITINSEDIAFLTTHTTSPISKQHFLKRNEEIDSVADILKKEKLPLIAIGDYNAVPWDSAIVAFKKKTGLQDSRKSLTPTFPRHLKAFGIPIDYIFHSDKIYCSSFEPVYNTSSDHAGIVGEYCLKNALIN